MHKTLIANHFQDQTDFYILSIFAFSLLQRKQKKNKLNLKNLKTLCCAASSQVYQLVFLSSCPIHVLKLKSACISPLASFTLRKNNFASHIYVEDAAKRFSISHYIFFTYHTFSHTLLHYYLTKRIGQESFLTLLR